MFPQRYIEVVYMPKAKYVKREYKKKINTYHNVMVALREGKNKSERKKGIKSYNSGSGSFNLSEKDINDILKPYAHIH